jgi:hypothetical protein
MVDNVVIVPAKILCANGLPRPIWTFLSTAWSETLRDVRVQPGAMVMKAHMGQKQNVHVLPHASKAGNQRVLLSRDSLIFMEDERWR